VGILAGGVLVAFVAIQVGILKQYQLDRLTAFTDPNVNTQTSGYNTQQARIAIGSGGMFGTGLFHGPQTQGHFVPENQTDFVYSVAGEELGFVGAALIIVLLGIILWRAIVIALRASDLFGRLVATGVATWIAFQAFENIGMNLGIMPVTGVPLPFVSYGGTSMFASWLAIGLLINVRLRAQE
jgi:rod shape determining protein RodA